MTTTLLYGGPQISPPDRVEEENSPPVILRKIASLSFPVLFPLSEGPEKVMAAVVRSGGIRMDLSGSANVQWVAMSFHFQLAQLPVRDSEASREGSMELTL